MSRTEYSHEFIFSRDKTAKNIFKSNKNNMLVANLTESPWEHYKSLQI